MAKPYAPLNEISDELTSAFVHGTDNHCHLVDASGCSAGGGYVRIETVDGAHWCLHEYTAVSTNDLTGITPCTLGVVQSDAAYTFPAGSPVSIVIAAEMHTNDNMPSGVALLAGRAGGQTLYGDTASGGNITIGSTAHATKGKQIWGAASAYDEADVRLGLGTLTPAQRLDILSGAIRFSYMTAPGACTAAELDEVGLVTVGDHYVKITFVNAIGQSDVGTASAVVAAAGSKKIRCTAIPVGTDATVTDRKVWMTAAGGTVYYYVGAIGDNTTTQYDINVADATLITQGAANTLGGTSSGGLYAGTTRIGGIDSNGYLDLWQDKNGDNKLVIRNDSTGTSARAGFVLANGSGAGDVTIFNLCGTGYTGITAWQDQFVMQMGGGISGGMRTYVSVGNWIVSRTATDANDLVVAASGNVGIGTATFGASAAGCLAIKNGTGPSAHLDDVTHIFSKDASSGGATLGLFTEYDIEDVGTFTPTKKGKIWWNGVEYWVQLDPV